MKKSTIPFLQCPKKKKCKTKLRLLGNSPADEISYGTLECPECHSKFPVLAGVAILVPDVRTYLLVHIKGISKFVPDSEIPKEYRREAIEFRKQIESEETETDLESDRVNALYLMNHYLSVKDSKEKWWKRETHSNPLISEWVEKYWDQGPFSIVEKWINQKTSVVELGCGVGGLAARISERVNQYLGVDSSFQSILLARHFNLGVSYTGTLKVPADLLQGGNSNGVTFKKGNPKSKANVDFIVGEIENTPVKVGVWDTSISLNAIDMLDDPRILAQVQTSLAKPGGQVIQSCPYIWNERTAKRLRSFLPATVKDSAKAVEWIYEKAGVSIQESQDDVPWLFFKHLRQIELYSVHLFKAIKN